MFWTNKSKEGILRSFLKIKMAHEPIIWLSISRRVPTRKELNPDFALSLPRNGFFVHPHAQTAQGWLVLAQNLLRTLLYTLVQNGHGAKKGHQC